MWTILAPILSGAGNTLRGRDAISTICFCLLVGACNAPVFAWSAFQLDVWRHCAVLFIGIAGGVAVWKAWRWGTYFAAFTGVWNRETKSTGWIDWIGFRLVPWVSAHDRKSNYRRGSICMGIRGAAFSLPLFLFLAWYISPIALALWPLMLAQGLFYGLMRYVSSSHGGAIQVGAAEFLTLYWMQQLFIAILWSATWNQ